MVALTEFVEQLEKGSQKIGVVTAGKGPVCESGKFWGWKTFPVKTRVG